MDGPHPTMTINDQTYPRPWNTTPLIKSAYLSRAAGCQIYLKLENLQPSGSFKSRGIGNLLLTRLSEANATNNTTTTTTNGETPKPKPHFYSSSGGNAGLGCVHAAVTLGCASTVVVPLSTTASMIDKIREAGATEVIQMGASWAEADKHLTEVVMHDARRRGENAVYVHPFDDPAVWAGHATMIDEIVEQLPSTSSSSFSSSNNPSSTSNTISTPNDTTNPPPLLDAIICSVGGGGLFTGIHTGLQTHNLSTVPILAIETSGADSLSQSLHSKTLITLPAITSIATSLGARTVAPRTFECAQSPNVISAVFSDAEAVDGCVRFAESERMLVEPACGVCVAVCLEGRLKGLLPGLKADSRVVVVVCGGSNVSVGKIGEWAGIVK